MKYFVLGAFSSAILLYGIALVYGATGTTRLDEIAGFLSRDVFSEEAVMDLAFGRTPNPDGTA